MLKLYEYFSPTLEYHIAVNVARKKILDELQDRVAARAHMREIVEYWQDNARPLTVLPDAFLIARDGETTFVEKWTVTWRYENFRLVGTLKREY